MTPVAQHGRVALVEIRGLARSYGRGDAAVDALRGIDLVVERGELVAILGRSGSGKSTLLHLLAGLDTPSSGDVRVGETDIGACNADALAAYRRTVVGVVFQSFHLLPGRTALENVALPLSIDGVPRAERLHRAHAALASVGLAARATHRPSELSGGEQQRVAVARALVRSPALLLCDEPTGNLDSATADGVATLLTQLVRERAQTVVVVTHDHELARRIATRIVVLEDGRVAREERVAS